MTSQELVQAFESWCIEKQCDVNPFCTSAKNKLAEMIHARDMSQKEQKSDVCSSFEAEWFRLRQESINISITPKELGNKIWQAACTSKEREMLLSRVQLPERKNLVIDPTSFNAGFNGCLDRIKLVPLTSEQVEKLLPDLCELNEMLVATIKEVNEYNDKNVSTRNLKSDAEVLLPKLRDFISKRLAGM